MRKVHHILVVGWSILLLTLVACSGAYEGEIRLSRSAVQVSADMFIQLHALNDADEIVDVDWSSADEAVATVSVDGLIRGVSSGMTLVKAYNDRYSAECAVWVTDDLDLSVYRVQKRSTKRGVGFSFPLQGDASLLASGVSWSYNWGSQPNPVADTEFMENSMDYCPMTWNGNFNEDQYRQYKQSHPNCKYLLAFNEPNLTDQANMTPRQAAEQWPRVKALADELGWKIVAPAMNYGTLAGYSDPVKWLDEFFTLVPKSDVCALALHCYMPNASAVKNYVSRFDKYGLPIWMTEFCAWDGFSASSPEPQIRYMSEVVNWMEKDERIERYAWFIPRGSQGFPYYELLDHNYPSNLTDAGKVYVQMSSLDKSVWHPACMILAQEYVDFSDVAPHLEASTDRGGVLHVSNFYAPQWLDYQVETIGTETTIELRYQTTIGAPIVRVWVDDNEAGYVTLPKTNGEWQVAQGKVSIPAGKHRIRLEMVEGVIGNIKLHWFRFL